MTTIKELHHGFFFILVRRRSPKHFCQLYTRSHLNLVYALSFMSMYEGPIHNSTDELTDSFT
jgi:hypothetical protein